MGVVVVRVWEREERRGSFEKTEIRDNTAETIKRSRKDNISMFTSVSFQAQISEMRKVNCSEH